MSEDTFQNYGLLVEEEINPKDWRAGGISAAVKSVLRENGNYGDILPDMEYQIGVYFDTMACVTFSALNCIEVLARFHDIKFNRSDRFTAKMSGTSKSGNYLSFVAESIRLMGTVDEPVWPYPRTQRDPVFDWDDFYKAIPGAIQDEGLSFLKDWKIQWEWIPVTRVREMLKFAPIQVTVRAWPKPGADGLYTDGGSTNRNHAVMLFNATDEYFEIYDHYDKSIKRLVPDYKFGSALQFTLLKNSPTPMPNITLPNNVLVQDVEDSGAFGMHLDGKIMLGGAAEILATVVMRAPRKVENGIEVVVLTAPRPLKKADWDSFPKVDLKNQPIQ